MKRVAGSGAVGLTVLAFAVGACEWLVDGPYPPGGTGGSTTTATDGTTTSSSGTGGTITSSPGAGGTTTSSSGTGGGCGAMALGCAFGDYCYMDECASCTDGVQDGDETAVDCGGAHCPPCANTKSCDVPADCESGWCESLSCFVCHGGVCEACSMDTQCATGDFCDLTNNGGTCTPQKVNGTTCTAADQCTSGLCAFTPCGCFDNVCPVCHACTACSVDTPCASGDFCDLTNNGGTCTP
jgi:hypothetical protein